MTEFIREKGNPQTINIMCIMTLRFYPGGMADACQITYIYERNGIKMVGDM